MLRANFGGLGKAQWTRTNMLLKQGKSVEILSTSFNTDVNLVRKELLDAGRLDENAIYRNMYDELAGDKTGASDCSVSLPDERPLISHPIEDDGFAVDKGAKPNTYRFYKDGLYRKFKSFRENGHLEFIDFYDENRNRTKREVYDDKGYLKKIEYMDLKNNNANTICFYNQKRKCYLSKWLDSETKNIVRINLFSDDGKFIKEFKTEDSLKRYWIEEYVIKHDNKPIIISDIRNFDNVVVNLNNNKLRRIAVIHTNHFEAPFRFGANISKDYKNLFSKVDKFSAIVFLTEQQKLDITNQFGEKTKYIVIPHSAPSISATDIIREDKTIVSVSRYDKMKNLDHLIKAFQKALVVVPDAKLELWGMGPEEDNLKSLVANLSLEKNVFIKGYTANSIEIFERATASVLTSSREGFGLVITESMAAGAPVISYDTNYGPRDIITDQKDGFIIEMENIEQLALAIINILVNPEKRKQMSAEARFVSEKFSFSNYTQKWLDLFDEL